MTGDKNSFPKAVVLPSGKVYGGRQDSFPTSAIMPDGTEYAGGAGATGVVIITSWCGVDLRT